MTIWRRLLLAIAAGLLAVLVLAGLWLWDPLDRTIDQQATTKAASAYKVEIIRDQWGVPHIFGVRDQDAAFGLGFAHAEDDFETIQETIAATRGTLARYRGAGAAPTDYLVRFLDVWETIDRRYPDDVPESVREYARAYADGLNLYGARNPEAVWAGLMPFRAEDVIAGFVFKMPFFYGLDEVLLDLFGDDYQQAIALDPANGRAAFTVGPRTMGERGSNAFAVAPSRTGDGSTLLLINSHQPLTGPVAWYEAHLNSQEGLNILGGTFPGAPVILHGFNPALGWANTVSKPDLSDTYVLTRNPTNPDQYRLDGEWVDFEKRIVSFRVRLFGPFAIPVRRKLLVSRHGPVIEAPHGTYAVRYAGRGEIRQLEQYLSFNHATNLGDFVRALEINALPSLNFVYADRDGNIFFCHNGQYPDRAMGWDWSRDLPGDRSDLIWDGYLPPSAMPYLVNPESGFLFNANNTPFVATDGSDNLKAEDFPPFMGLQTDMTNRALRIGERTRAGAPIDKRRLLQIKFDKTYAEGSLARAIIDEVLAKADRSDPQIAAALDHLAAWDFSTGIDNRHAALGVLTVLPEVTAPFTRAPIPPRKDAFRAAADLLMKTYGRLDIPWGDVNRLERGAQSWPIGGGPDILRAVYPVEIRDDGKLPMSAGDSWIGLVKWDAQGRQSAEIIHNFGSATLSATSPHFADQAPLFVREQFRPAEMDYDRLTQTATRRYAPLEPK